MSGKTINSTYLICNICNSVDFAYFDKGLCPKCKKGYIQIYNFTIETESGLWKSFQSGNVVKWNGSFWVVIKAYIDYVVLIGFSGQQACPTLHQPNDPLQRVDSIYKVSENIKEFILNSLWSIFEFTGQN